MKNYFFITFIVLLTATNFSNTLFAQSTNERNKALNNYFETIIKDTTQVVFVAKEKITSNETIHIFGLNDIMIIDSAGNGTGDTTLFKKKDFEIMKKKYKNNCIQGRLNWCDNNYWTKEDFRHKKIILESVNYKNGIEPIFKKYNNLNIKVYSFSEPIYYQNKKYIVFTIIRLGFDSGKTNIIIMRKIKGKWIVSHKGENPNIMN
jgi:hypothetical protein